LPGLVTGPSAIGALTSAQNASSPLAAGIPQLRGALPYETQSLIDGHPISLGAVYYDQYGGSPIILHNGQLGYAPGNVVGPSTASLKLHVGL
jgi:hypothetical protein